MPSPKKTSKPAPFAPKRILAAVDFSKASLGALAAAKSLALRFGASLDLLYVQDQPQSLLGLSKPDERLDARTLKRELGELRRWHEDQLRKAAKGFPPKRLSVFTQEGGAARRILELADKRGSDLLVLGTHGRSGTARLLLGSVAEYVVRRSKTPVLTVHAG